MHLAYTADANALLERDPLALLIGMLLDQQIPMEKAFTSPEVLRERLGHDLDATEIATYDPAAFEELFRTPPALHRFPAAMAKRVQALAQVLVERYDGTAAAVWQDVSDGAQLDRGPELHPAIIANASCRCGEIASCISPTPRTPTPCSIRTRSRC